MKKADLVEIASFGIHHKLRDMERQLAAMWKLFPDLFLSTTAPQLLRPEPRGKANGHWPAGIKVSLEKDNTTKKRAGKKATKRAAKKTVTTGTPIDLQAYQKIHAFLEEHGGATLSEVAKGIKVHPANLRHKLLLGVDRGFFARQTDGGFHAKAAPLPDE